jgi:hypothetical protein
MGFTKLEKSVLNVSALPDRVENQAQQLKATFDQAGEDIKEAHNQLIDELGANTAAGNIGAVSSKTGAKTTVQAELDKLNDRIKVDFTELEIDIDDELDTESENAVKNKAIAKEVNTVKGALYAADRYNKPVVTGEDGNYTNNLSLPLTSYEVGKIVNIEGSSYEGITTFENPYLNINNLGAKQINGTIVAGEKYNLIYNGENFDISKPNKQKIVDYTFTEDTEQIIFDNLNVPEHETISIKIIGATSGSEPAGLQINDITSEYIASSGSDLTKCPLPTGFSNNYGAILKANIMRNYQGFPFVICENFSATTRQTYYSTSSIIATKIVKDINKLIFFASTSNTSAKFEAGTKIEIWKEW